MRASAAHTLRRVFLCVMATAIVATVALAEDKADLDAIAKIKDEGMNRSQVMKTLSYLTDVHGPRLTGSPGIRRAQDWAQQQLQEWGMENVHTEAFKFGRGWDLKRFSSAMIQPTFSQLIAYPKAWTPGTKGRVRAEAVRVDIRTEADLAKYHGKLKGLIVLPRPPREVQARFTPLARRYTDDELGKLAQAPAFGRGGRVGGQFGGAFGGQGGQGGPGRPGAPGAQAGPGGPVAPGAQAGPGGPGRPGQQAGPGGPGRAGGPGGFPNRQLQRKIDAFWVAEGVAAVIEPSRGDGGTVFVQSGGDYAKGAAPVAPQLIMAAEHYNRICRILETNTKVKLEVEVSAAFLDQDLHGYNVIAEIPGTDKKDEVVMVGGHFDSWHAGTGATDNAAGSAVAMEVLRILKASGLQPRRTIRLALWSGEEEGLLGSRAYVDAHFATRSTPPAGGGAPGSAPPPANGGASTGDAPSGGTGAAAAPTPPANGGEPGGGFRRGSQAPLILKPEYAKLSAYWNLDNGTGKIRGIYLQGNEALRPIFAAWLAPFQDMGASTLTIRNTGGTDHQSFDGVGLPGFQFIQDEIDYESRTHHSNMDLYDRLQSADLMQAAVIEASLVYQTAMRDELLPRKPQRSQPPRPTGGATQASAQR
jgi:carboxypeptidase Q